jgi:ABC-type polysaccharide/polyol phosphate export permease
MLEFIRRGIADIGATLNLSNVWWELASEDIADSHRRTTLGPIWPLLNYLLLVGTLLMIFGNGASSSNFTGYVASGMLVWLFINDTLSMSASLFVREQSFIKGTVLPISLYVMRQTLMITMRSFYALLGTVPILLLSGIHITPALLSVVPAIFLLLLTAPAVAVLFGIVGAFFRDFQFVVTNVMRLMMFITPIFWAPDGIGGWHGFLYHWNPLTHYIDIVRRPVIEGVVPMNSWAIALLISALLSIVALFLLGKFQRQIVFQL